MTLALLALVIIAIGVYVVRIDEETHWVRDFERVWRENGHVIHIYAVVRRKGDLGG